MVNLESGKITLTMAVVSITMTNVNDTIIGKSGIVEEDIEPGKDGLVKVLGLTEALAQVPPAVKKKAG